MVNKEKIRQKIQYIEENSGKLDKLKNYTLDEFVGDFRNVEAAKHLLQVNIEAMIDVANHIIARNRWTTPATSSESLNILRQHGYFDEQEQQLFNRMVKFRNRVVHLYHVVDDAEIYKILQERLDDFSLFIKAVTGKLF